MAGLTSLEDALSLLLDNTVPVADTETLALDLALGRVLAEPVFSPVAVPYDDNSAMDGYALRSDDGEGPLKVTQRIPAGSVGGCSDRWLCCAYLYRSANASGCRLRRHAGKLQRRWRHIAAAAAR